MKIKKQEDVKMGIKKQIGMGIMSAALGLTLVGGGTFAYFSDSETTSNTFAAGTLDLSANPTTIVDVDELTPGDSVTRDFELQNNGTLDIDKVFLETDYTVDGAANFAKHIQVEFMYNADKADEVIYETTLYELKEMNPEVVGEHVLDPVLGSGLEAGGDVDDLVVKFTFVDDGEDQNNLQGAELELEWTFTAVQGEGEEK